MTNPPRDARILTRDSLIAGAHLIALRAIPGMQVKSDAEIDASLDAALAARPADAGEVWLFGYGSLMWNPAFHFAERQPATILGWHRRFCVSLVAGRGTPDAPGLTLGLDRGGSVQGVAFRLPPGEERGELRVVWRREMFSGTYLARWVAARTAKGPVPALTFIVNRSGPRYLRALDEAETVYRLATATGRLGSCAAYLSETVDQLRALGLRDRALERLEREVNARLATARPAE